MWILRPTVYPVLHTHLRLVLHPLPGGNPGHDPRAPKGRHERPRHPAQAQAHLRRERLRMAQTGTVPCYPAKQSKDETLVVGKANASSTNNAPFRTSLVDKDVGNQHANTSIIASTALARPFQEKWRRNVIVDNRGFVTHTSVNLPVRHANSNRHVSTGDRTPRTT